MSGLRARIEAYFDAAPRAAADVEEHGALTLFVSRIPWRYYARPRAGRTGDVRAADIAAVRARQRELGVREAFEWVHETTPSFAGAAREAGLEVLLVPLLALDAAVRAPASAPAGVTVRLLTPDDPALDAAQDAVERAFGEEPPPAPRDSGFLRDRLARGLTGMAVAETTEGAVGAGSHQPVGDATELMGIGTVPAARRRGIGAALTTRLVQDAHERGAELVLLSAADDAVARGYERLGFRRAGTAGFAWPA